MKSKHPMDRQRGFTLTEIMMAAAITVLLIMGAQVFLNKTLKRAKLLENSGKTDTSFRSFGQKLIFDLQAADTAIYFQRLPIPVSGCDSKSGFIKDGPCVYETLDSPSADDPKKSIKILRPSSLISKLGSIKTMDFYADRDANLVASPSTFTISKTIDNPFYIRAMTSIDPRLILSFRDHPTYTTWVLKSPSSPAFPMMIRSSLQDDNKRQLGTVYFTVADESASSSPPTAAGRWVILRANQANVPVDQLVGKAIAFYNSYDPQQFLLQKINAALNCAKQSCDQITNALGMNPKSSTPNSENFVAFELTPLPLLPVTIPNASDAGSWWSQNPNQFAFPSEYPSFFAADTSDFTAPADLRKLIHYYHTLRDINNQPYRYQMIGLPVDIMLYSLESQGNDGKKRLVRQAFLDNAKPSKVLDDIPADSVAVFARKIGTKEISFYTYNP